VSPTTNTARLVLGLCAATLVALLAPPLASRAAERPKPNVLFILSDDQGSVDANCYGAHDLVTPAIDALAVHGVRFTQFYSAAPVCSPSRAGILTGRYPWLAGMPNNGASPPSEADDQLETLTGEGLPAQRKNAGGYVPVRRLCYRSHR